MLSGRAWAGYFGPTRVMGRAWVGKNDDLLKARPDGFLARRAGLGQKFAARQSGRARPGPQNTESGFSLARPDPARPELMPRYNPHECIPPIFSVLLLRTVMTWYPQYDPLAACVLPCTSAWTRRSWTKRHIPTTISPALKSNF
jgi:hypothetical protein